MYERTAQAIHDPDVRQVLNVILHGAQTMLGNLFVGMYVHGSLAIGDFDAGRSDIDFLVATAADDLPDRTYAAIRSFHERIAASGLKWATNIEGSYIPLSALRRHDPSRSLHPALRCDGSFGMDRHGAEWIVQRHIVREYGIVLAGPEPHTIIEPVEPDTLRTAVVQLLRDWWQPQLKDSFRLAGSEYQAYAVLTMCRALYTLRHGTVASKPAAGRWAMDKLDERWVPLIEQALNWRHGIELQLMNDTLAFIRFTLEQAERETERYSAEGGECV
ncbi:hypothetical protein SD70_12485 [Gordoniibacillus kamchatkensis]|uniref:Adenylyltransferase AadA C-terminal domain-containing protein n=1 Tax=Gordoniibacillus kamchatkensis TaxID=1590651 RepID=A0ABR5AHY5_9BACL|nr:aminoglycoside adenylyltransferase domain-containing protein [Paenibacillus sp. VKM B-2647]KIL40565.1 hypothetical protein SD70_12485 [Paenibacillus sp. VKM B-2647]